MGREKRKPEMGGHQRKEEKEDEEKNGKKGEKRNGVTEEGQGKTPTMFLENQEKQPKTRVPPTLSRR